MIPMKLAQTPTPTPTTPRAPKDQRFNMRMSTNQRQLISRAASVLDKSESDFMLDVATAEAERVLTDRRWFTVDDDSWDRFQELLDAPIPYENDLRDLLARPTVFGKK